MYAVSTLKVRVHAVYLENWKREISLHISVNFC